MKGLISICLAAGLLAGAASSVRAGAVLLDSSVSTSNTGYISTEYPNIATLGSYSDQTTGAIGSPLPNSASVMSPFDSASASGSTISSNGNASLALSPSASSFTQLTAITGGMSSINLSTSPPTIFNNSTGNTSSSGADFTLSAPAAYTLSLAFSGSSFTTANTTDGVSRGSGQQNYSFGYFELKNADTGFDVVRGSNEITDDANQPPQLSGGIFHTDSNGGNITISSAYTPTYMETGLLPAGTYSFETLTEANNQVIGYTATGNTSASQTVTLTLSPAPEPASLTLLSLGAAALAVTRCRRRPPIPTA